MKRFPLALAYRFVQEDCSGCGTTVAVSSETIEVAEKLPPGKVRLEIDWPARLDDGCALRVVVYGRVLPSGVVSVVRHEFRTRSTRMLALLA